jgi:2-keto-3-deoxy-L-rhamnonate aldolase RhmA
MEQIEVMPVVNLLREKLAAGSVTSSMIVRLSRGAEIARIARSAGFDALYVDLEHSGLTLDTTGQICTSAADLGVTPLVRVPGLFPELIGQVLDVGALGVIIPGVETAAQARLAAESARFAPLGRRSVSSVLPQLQYRTMPNRLGLDWVNAQMLVAVMVESPASVANIDDIAAVSGIDLLHIGLHDLTASFGYARRPSDETVLEILAPVFASAARHGKWVGIGGLGSSRGLLTALLRHGVRFVSAGTDLGFLLSAATESAAFVRGLGGSFADNLREPRHVT